MTDDSNDRESTRDWRSNGALSDPYRVRGSIDDDAGDGSHPTGVLGEATGSGTTYGLVGHVTSSSGYGVYTPDDAAVGGHLRTSSLGLVPTVLAADATVTDRSRVLVDTAAGSITVTLGTDLLRAGRVVKVLDDAGQADRNPIVVRTEGSATIEPGATTEKTVEVPWSELELVPNAGEDHWRATGRNVRRETLDVDTVNAGAVRADSVRVRHSLPPYSAVGEDPERARDALGALFDESAWTDGLFRSGPAHAERHPSFHGATLTPTGEVVFVPYYSENVGVYDVTSGRYTSGPAHGQGDYPFYRGALAPDGTVVFAPFESDVVGIYDPATGNYADGPTHGEGSNPFRGAALAPDGTVVFAPFSSDVVGVYDPVAGTYASGPAHGEGSAAFNGATLTVTGEVVFVPWDSGNVGIYDPATGDYASGPAIADPGRAFSGAATTPDGRVVFAPMESDTVGVYDPATGNYADGPTHGEGGNAFAGATSTATGDVVLVPNNADSVGLYDPSGGNYTSGPTHGQGDGAFGQAALAPDGRVVFAPHHTDTVGVFDAFAQTDDPRSTALHPLVNNA